MNDIHFTILAIIVVFLTACESKERNIFWISEPNGKENDFLFMVESTNVAEISSDSLRYFLTQEELVSFKKIKFKNYGKIHSDKRFDVYVILKEGNARGRDYTFVVRTFDKNSKIIDSYDLASWIESKNTHCFGSIDEHLIIRRSCKRGKNIEVKKITNDGSIITP